MSRPAPDEPTGGDQAHLQIYQEEQIDKIAETVRLQKAIGNQIIREIDEQHKMIIELDEGIEDAHTAMKQVTQRITRLIDTEGRVPTYLVALLSVILIFMLWWVA
jgi:very-short-patch-repair endonuclease